MSTCRVCGAALTPDLEWCPQCLTPVARSPERAGPTQVAGSPAGGTVDDEGAYSKPPTSVLRAGPNSFGIVGKLIFTGLALVGGYVLYRAGRVIVDFYGHGGLALVWLFLGIYSVVVILVLWNVWRQAPVEPETRVYPRHSGDDADSDETGDTQRFV